VPAENLKDGKGRFRSAGFEAASISEHQRVGWAGKSALKRVMLLASSISRRWNVSPQNAKPFEGHAAVILYDLDVDAVPSAFHRS